MSNFAQQFFHFYMTLISHKHKFIFLANQKCASTSIHEFLRPYSDKAYTIWIHQKPLGTHATAAEVKKYMEKRKYNWEDYFVFTTIREPFSRIKSCYYYEIDFSVNRDLTDLFRPTPKDFKKYVMGDWFMKRFLDIEKFTCDKQGNNLVSKIMRIEDATKEMPEILKKLGINEDWNAEEARNISKKPHPVSYDEEMKEHIYSFGFNDFKYYPESQKKTI